jgi:hypothetical protein
MKKKPNNTSKYKGFFQILNTILRSNIFFYLIMSVFAAELLLLAFSATYPMLFDEEYHLGIIDIYSRQISPFMTTQPLDAAFHGDITRYGSYLFHYLMSWPYRFIQLFTHDIMTSVIALRLICISMVLSGVFVWRKALTLLRVSTPLIHSTFLIFILITNVPFALSQLNYDAGVFLLTPTILYVLLKIWDSPTLNPVWIALFIVLASIAPLVKFTMLPIVAVCAVIVGVIIWKRRVHIRTSLSGYSKLQKTVMSIAIIGAAGLFCERYVYNILVYRALEPKCHKIHSKESCQEYTVWRRDTSWTERNIGKPRNNPAVYTATYWLPQIVNDFFVTGAFIDKSAKEVPSIRYLPKDMQASKNTTLFRVGGMSIALVSIIVLLFTLKKVSKSHRKLLILTATLLSVYALSMWLRNYTDYLKIGAGTAAQGRYYIPLLIPIIATIGVALQHRLTVPALKYAFLSVILLLFSQGGGIMGYIMTSNYYWYWPAWRDHLDPFYQSLRSLLPLIGRS